MNRREFTSLSLGALSASAVHSNGPQLSEGLARTAARRGLFFGSAIRSVQLETEHDLSAAIDLECAYIVPEIELKWAALEPTYGNLSFASMDSMADYAKSNNKRIRGHTLLWHRSIPGWADERLSSRNGWDLISRFFGSVMPRYGDVISQWDVINEPIDAGHRSDGLRQSVFLSAFGPEYIDRALIEARKYAPNATLLINEYGLEYDNPEQRDRRYLLLKLLERLKSRKIPIDGVGLQSHLDLRLGSISQPALATFLRHLASMDLSVYITELDVKEAQYTAPQEDRDRYVAQEVRRFLDVVLDQRATKGIVTWGLSDRQSWLEVGGEDYARYPNAWRNGTSPGLNRGLPLDASLTKKPMYFAIRDVLSASRAAS